jgi:hypothetical protein
VLFKRFLSKGTFYPSTTSGPYEIVSRAQQRVLIFNQCGGRFFDFSKGIRPKNKLGEFQFWVGIFFRKEKKEKTANPEFRIIKKKEKSRYWFYKSDPVWLGFWVLKNQDPSSN